MAGDLEGRHNNVSGKGLMCETHKKSLKMVFFFEFQHRVQSSVSMMRSTHTHGDVRDETPPGRIFLTMSGRANEPASCIYASVIPSILLRFVGSSFANHFRKFCRIVLLTSLHHIFD